MAIFEGSSQRVLIGAERSQRLASRSIELVQVGKDVIGKIVVFRMLPALFHRIQFGAVARKLLELKPLAMTLLEVLGRGTVDAPAIPDQDHLAVEVGVHRREKVDEFVGRDVLAKQLEVEAHAAGSPSR